MKNKCRRQSDTLGDCTLSSLARDIIIEATRSNDQPHQGNGRLTRDLTGERLNSRIITPPDLLDVVF